MKKLLFIFGLSTILFSCSNEDNDENNQENQLIGKWEYYEINTFTPGTDLSGDLQLIEYPQRCDSQKDYMVFGEDGSAKNVFNYSDCFQDVSLGTYSRNDFILSIDFEPYEDEMSQDWEILSISNDFLTISAPNPAPPSEPEEINVFKFIKIE